MANPTLGLAMRWATGERCILDRADTRPSDVACCACGTIGHRMPLDPGWRALGHCSDGVVNLAMAESGLPRSLSGFWAFDPDCFAQFLDSQRGHTAWTRYLTATGQEFYR